ncbi:hypothetical protein D3C81_2203840 [compost metagenome]
MGQIPDHSRETLKQVLNGQHPSLHDTVLQLFNGTGDMVGYIAQPLYKFLIAEFSRNGLLQLGQRGLVYEKLADQIH